MYSDSDTSQPSFGEAIAFYSIKGFGPNDDITDLFVVYRPVTRLHQVLSRWQGWWADSIVVARASSIHAIIGIWEGPLTKTVYIIRKHPALDMLNDVELGKQPEPESINETDTSLYLSMEDHNEQ